MAGHKTMGGWMDVTSEIRNEIVFEGKNKEYGAYYVRKRYRQIILIALGTSIGIMVAGVGIPLLLKELNKNKKEDVVTIKVDLKAPPPTDPHLPPPPPPPPPPKQPIVNQLKVTPPVIAKINVDTNIATVKQVQATNIGVVNQKGKDTLVMTQIAAPAATGDDPNKIWSFVQQKPHFPGDIYQYLQDHIEYPEQAREAGVQGTVYLTFVVEKDGSITQVKILRGVTSELNDEAIRQVSHMPKWTPGQQNGHPVRATFMLPIKFSLH